MVKLIPLLEPGILTQLFNSFFFPNFHLENIKLDDRRRDSTRSSGRTPEPDLLLVLLQDITITKYNMFAHVSPIIIIIIN